MQSSPNPPPSGEDAVTTGEELDGGVNQLSDESHLRNVASFNSSHIQPKS